MDDSSGLNATKLTSDSVALLPAVRHERALQILKSHFQVTVTTLSDMLGVSVDTVRRDLLRLENRGLIIRTHGGAMLKPPTRFATSSEQPNEDLANRHRLLCELVAGFIPDGSTLIVNGGAINVRLAEALHAHRNLTVVTNNIGFAATISPQALGSLHILGGTYCVESCSTSGPVQFSEASDIVADIAIIAVSGVSSGGIAMTRLEDASIASRMMATARDVIVLADSKAFGVTAFAKIADWSRVSILVTDFQPSNQFALQLHKSNCLLKTI